MRRLHIRIDLQGSASENVRHGYTPAYSGWMIPVADDVTIEGLAAAITESYRRRYPDFAKKEPDLNIIEVQDGYGCSLDMDYSVGEVFDPREASSDSKNYTVHVVRGPLTPAEIGVIHARTNSPTSASSPAPGSSVRIPKRSVDSDFTFFPRPEHPFKRRKVTSDVFHLLSDSDHASSVERDEPRRIPLHSSQLHRTITPDRSQGSGHSVAGNQDVGDMSNLDFISAPQSPRIDSPVAESRVQDNSRNPAKGLTNGEKITTAQDVAAPVKNKGGRPRKSDTTAATKTPKKAANSKSTANDRELTQPKKPGRKKKQDESQASAPIVQSSQDVALSIESNQKQAGSPEAVSQVKSEPKKRKQQSQPENTEAEEIGGNQTDHSQAAEEGQAKKKGGKPSKRTQTSTVIQEGGSGDEQALKKPRARKSTTATTTQVANDGFSNVENNTAEQTNNPDHTENKEVSMHPSPVNQNVVVGSSQARGSQNLDQSDSEPEESGPKPEPVGTTAATKAQKAAAKRKKDAAERQYLMELASMEVPPEAAAHLKEAARQAAEKKPSQPWVPGGPGRPPKNAKEIMEAASQAQMNQEVYEAESPQPVLEANVAPEDSTQSSQLQVSQTSPEAARPTPVRAPNVKKKSKETDLNADATKAASAAPTSPNESKEIVQRNQSPNAVVPAATSTKKKTAPKSKSNEGIGTKFKAYIPPGEPKPNRGQFTTMPKDPSPPQTTSQTRASNSDGESSTGSNTTAASRPTPKPSNKKPERATPQTTAQPSSVSKGAKQPASKVKAQKSTRNESDTSSMSEVDSDVREKLPTAKWSKATKRPSPAATKKVPEKSSPAPARSKKATKQPSIDAAKKAEITDSIYESAPTAPSKALPPKASSPKVVKAPPKAPLPPNTESDDTSSEDSDSGSDDNRPGNKLPPPQTRPSSQRQPPGNTAAVAGSSQTMGGSQQGTGGNSASNGAASEAVQSFTQIRKRVKQPPYKSPLPPLPKPALAPTDSEESESDESSSEDDPDPQPMKAGSGGPISSLKKR